MYRLMISLAMLGAFAFGVGYVHAQEGEGEAVAWPDRATLVDWIDNEPEQATQAIEQIVSGMSAEDADAAIAVFTDAVQAWQDARLRQQFGADVVIERVAGEVVIRVPQE